jgi:hypothetical protein
MVWEGAELARLVMRMCHVKKKLAVLMEGGSNQRTKEEFGIWGTPKP